MHNDWLYLNLLSVIFDNIVINVINNV